MLGLSHKEVINFMGDLDRTSNNKLHAVLDYSQDPEESMLLCVF
jgi:hypothetical protein